MWKLTNKSCTHQDKKAHKLPSRLACGLTGFLTSSNFFMVSQVAHFYKMNDIFIILSYVSPLLKTL